MSKYDFSELDDGEEKQDEKYDFSEVDEDQKEKEENKNKIGGEIKGNDIPIEDDPRNDLRVTRCCGNCKFYYYTGVKSRRGYCKLTNIKYQGVGAYHKHNIADIAEKFGWPETHSTCVCDSHQIRSLKTSIYNVGDWVNRNFDAQGRPVHDDLGSTADKEEEEDDNS